ncbi:MAG: ABC transporter permease subunit [Proteobacteria bacterium]|nr:ABC transporter permease subunit [Pseudomonadota bacterium]NIS72646.1 ABC transporter permease subunit [Pseudomonadota bacterium]
MNSKRRISFQLYRTLHILWKLRMGTLGSLIVVFACCVAIFASFIAPHNPYEGEITKRLMPPFWIEGGTKDHILGTDQVGRDLLTRIIFGSRVSLVVGFASVLISVTIGVFLGLISGYYGSIVDWIISSIVNIMLTFPFVLLALAVIAVVGPSFQNMLVVLGLTSWPFYTRVVRAEVLKWKELDFVEAARAMGMKSNRILFSQIFPNILNSVLVLSSLQVARFIILEAFLSFLGLGVQPPTPSWGGMLGDARVYMLTSWWLATFPGLAIFVATFGISLMGDGIRDFFDPHLRYQFLSSNLERG